MMRRVLVDHARAHVCRRRVAQPRSLKVGTQCNQQVGGGALGRGAIDPPPRV